MGTTSSQRAARHSDWDGGIPRERADQRPGTFCDIFFLWRSHTLHIEVWEFSSEAVWQDVTSLEKEGLLMAFGCFCRVWWVAQLQGIVIVISTITGTTSSYPRTGSYPKVIVCQLYRGPHLLDNASGNMLGKWWGATSFYQAVYRHHCFRKCLTQLKAVW